MKLNEWDINDPRNLDKAFKGGAPAKSQAQIEAEEAQARELKDLQAKEDARVKAMQRKRAGRASLLSGEETGMKESLGA